MDKSRLSGLSREAGAIATVFDGVEYKSRTEAKWAVFFNRLGVDFTYEQKKFNITQESRYTPDFYVKDFNAVIEVKPDDRDIILNEAHKIAILRSKPRKLNVWLILGPPDPTKHNIIDMSHNERTPPQWRRRMGVPEFLDTKDLHNQILEDRRDPGYYWLGNADWTICRGIGGPRADDTTDHGKYPVSHWNVEDAYRRAARAFTKEKDPQPWKGDPDF